jgi:hypothetical protein
MAEPIFDHEKLDVYRLSIEYVAGEMKRVQGEMKRVQDWSRTLFLAFFLPSPARRRAAPWIGIERRRGWLARLSRLRSLRVAGD